ncbi:MAG: tetratricopeptide repeat protein [Gemmatales bacterium]
MHRVFKIRIFVVLLLIAVVLGVGIYFLHNYQIKNQVKIYLQQADQAVAEKDMQKAREYLERYLRMRPDEILVFNRLAFMVDDAASTTDSFVEKSRAYLTLEKALRQYTSQKSGEQLQPPVELYQRLAARSFNLKRYRDATVHLETLLKLKPNDPDHQEMLADCQRELGKLNEAEKLYKQLVESSPKRVSSHKSLAAIYTSKKDYQQAEECLKKMILENTNSIEARQALIDFLDEQGRLSDAARENKIVQDMIEAEKVDPADKARANWLFSSAKLALAQRNPKDKSQSEQKIAEALQQFSLGMQQFPNDVRFYIGKAQLELTQTKTGKAAVAAILQQAIPLLGNDPNQQFAVAKLLIDAGDRQEATRLADTLRNKFGAVPVVEYLSARLLVDKGKVGEAITILERIKENLASIPPLAVESNLLLMAAYERLENPDRRLAAVERILKVDPSIPSAQVSKADILASMGRTKDAIDIYCRQLATVPVVRIPLARLLMAAEANKPEAQRDWKEVNALLAQCTAEEKQSKEYILSSFQLLTLMGKRDELEKVVNQACLDHPKEVVYWMAKLNNELVRPGLDDKARTIALEKLLQDAEHAAGDHAEFRLAKALTLIGLPRDKVLSSLETLERGTEQWKPQDKIALSIGLARFYFGMGFTKDARRLCNNVLAIDTAYIPALQLLIDLATDEKDDTETERLINVMREKEGNEGYRWRLAAINRLFTKLRGGERQVMIDARKLVDELTNLRPAWFHTQTVQGQLAELNGLIDQSLDSYKRAIEMGERNPEVVKKTVQMLTVRRRPEEAQQILSLVINPANVDTAYSKLATEIALRFNYKDSAITLESAKKTIRPDSQDYRDFLWLGNVLWAAGDKPGAEAALKKALALGKEQPDVWANWLAYLINVDRKSEAEAELKRAESILKENMTYVLTSYYKTLGQNDKAEEQYVKLVNSNPNDIALLQSLVSFYFQNGDFAKAEALLKKQIDTPLIEAGTLNWARRSYALTLAAKPDFPSYKEALKLIEKNLKENSNSPEDLRVRALILSTRPGPRQDLIKDLELSFSLLKPSAMEAVLLAQLHEEEGNWNKAKTILDEAATSNEGEAPNFLTYYILALLRQKEKPNVDLAAQLMQKLENKAQGKTIIIEPKARLLLAQGRHLEAVTYLESQAEKLFSERNDATLYAFASNLLDQAGQTQSAEKLIKKFVEVTSKKTPITALALVEFYARHDRVSEALKICDEQWNKIPVGNVAMAAAAVLHSEKAAASDIKHIEDKLIAASKSANQDIGVALALADVFNLQKRFADSETLYRQILQQDKFNPYALNNLAWQLSDRPNAFAEAIELITRAIDKHGPEGAFLDTRGMIFLRNNKTDQALKDLLEAVTKSPTPVHWLHLAYAQHQARKEADAARSWNKTMSLGLQKENLSRFDKDCVSELERAYRQ